MDAQKRSRPFNASKLVVRYALGSDYETVMKISHGVYGGRDILPAMYHTYLYDPTRHMYLAEYEGQVVGFAIARIMDDDTAYEGQLARVHPQFQNLGIFKGMRHLFIKSYIAPRFPNVKKVIGSSLNVDSVRRDTSVIISDTRSVLEFAWKVPLSDVIKALQRYQVISEEAYNFSPAGREELLPLFTDASHPFRTKYIPSGIILRDAQLFNMDYVLNLYLLLQDRCNDRFITYDQHGEMQSVSLGTGTEAGVSMEMFRYTIDYYGVCNLDLLKAHIMQHMSKIPALYSKSKIAKNISISVITLSKSFDKKQLQELSRFTTNELGFYRGDFPMQVREQVLGYEKQYVVDMYFKSKL